MVANLQKDNIEWLLQKMQLPLAVFLMLFVLMATYGIALAGDSVSSAFTFDARYDVFEYVPEGSSASMFFKVTVRLSDDY